MKDEYREIGLCARDVVYFTETYFMITNLAIGRTTVKLYDSQVEVLTQMANNSNVIGLTARQTGMSMLSEAYALWDTMFSPNKTIGILYPKMDTGVNAMHRIHQAYDDMPDYIKPKVKVWNKREIVFENDSRIIVSSNAMTLRDMSLTGLMVGDVGYLNDNQFDEMFSGLYQEISSGEHSKFIIWSAPNGKNAFHKLWKKCGGNGGRYRGWSKFKLQWDSVPSRNAAWKVDAIKSLGQNAFKREMECKFIG